MHNEWNWSKSFGLLMLFEVGEEEEEEEKGLVEVDKERPRVVSEEEGRRK